MELMRKNKEHGRYVLYFDKIALQVTGINLPQCIKSFTEAKLCPLLQENIKIAGYEKPTPIQKGAISVILAKRDLIACADTGSGKTVAYLVPVMNMLLEQCVTPYQSTVQKPEVIIVAPTNELAIQIHRESCKFTINSELKSVLFCSDASVTGLQPSNIQAGYNILVATIGHLMDVLDQGLFDFSCVKFLIFEKLDEIINMGFGLDIQKIFEHSTIPPKGVRRTCMVSSTFSEAIQALAAVYLDNHIFVTSSIVCDTKTDIKQEFLQCGRNEKRKKLIEILNDKVKEKNAMVFVETQKTADFVTAFLCKNSIQATSIHGGCLQSQCETVLSEFKLGVRKILVITNVAARGLDIAGVDFVINYDLPASFEKYVNRVRKIGLMGNLGQSISFFDDEMDMPNAGKLVSWLTKSNAEVPAFLQTMVSCFGFFNGDDFKPFPEKESGFASREICLVDD